MVGVNDDAGKQVQLAWLSWNRQPFIMTNESEVLMPDERLLERHWLGVVYPDPGGGPTGADFWAAVSAQAGGLKTSGVKLK